MELYTDVAVKFRIDNQSGYRVSLASYTAHSETPNDSNPNGEMIDAKLIFIFVLLFFFLAVCNSSLSRAFGEFPNVVSRDNAFADRRKGVFYSKMLHLFRTSHILISDLICYRIMDTFQHLKSQDFPTAIVHSLVQRPVPNHSGIQGSNIQG